MNIHQIINKRAGIEVIDTSKLMPFQEFLSMQYDFGDMWDAEDYSERLINTIEFIFKRKFNPNEHLQYRHFCYQWNTPNEKCKDLTELYEEWTILKKQSIEYPEYFGLPYRKY